MLDFLVDDSFLYAYFDHTVDRMKNEQKYQTSNLSL